MKTSRRRDSEGSPGTVRSPAGKPVNASRRAAVKGADRLRFVGRYFADYLLSLRERRAADHYRRVYSIGGLITPNSVRIRAILRPLRTRIKRAGNPVADYLARVYEDRPDEFFARIVRS